MGIFKVTDTSQTVAVGHAPMGKREFIFLAAFMMAVIREFAPPVAPFHWNERRQRAQPPIDGADPIGQDQKKYQGRALRR